MIQILEGKAGRQLKKKKHEQNLPNSAGTGLGVALGPAVGIAVGTTSETHAADITGTSYVAKRLAIPFQL